MSNEDFSPLSQRELAIGGIYIVFVSTERGRESESLCWNMQLGRGVLEHNTWASHAC